MKMKTHPASPHIIVTDERFLSARRRHSRHFHISTFSHFHICFLCRKEPL